MKELTKEGTRGLEHRDTDSCHGLRADRIDTEGYKVVRKCKVCNDEWYQPMPGRWRP